MASFRSFVSVRDIEAAGGHHGCCGGGGENSSSNHTTTTIKDTESSYEKWIFRPRVLRNVNHVSVETTLLDQGDDDGSNTTASSSPSSNAPMKKIVTRIPIGIAPCEQRDREMQKLLVYNNDVEEEDDDEKENETTFNMEELCADVCSTLGAPLITTHILQGTNKIASIDRSQLVWWYKTTIPSSSSSSTSTTVNEEEETLLPLHPKSTSSLDAVIASCLDAQRAGASAIVVSSSSIVTASASESMEDVHHFITRLTAATEEAQAQTQQQQQTDFTENPSATPPVSSLSSLPVIVMGALKPETVVRAVKAGAAGILLCTATNSLIHPSTETTTCSLDLLRPALLALQKNSLVAPLSSSSSSGGSSGRSWEKVSVYLVDDTRRGGSVFKALALGAKAVFVHRPIAWGIAVEVTMTTPSSVKTIEDTTENKSSSSSAAAASTTTSYSPITRHSRLQGHGISTVLSLLQEELVNTMQLCGVVDVNDITSEYIARKPTSAVAVAQAFKTASASSFIESDDSEVLAVNTTTSGSSRAESLALSKGENIQNDRMVTVPADPRTLQLTVEEEKEAEAEAEAESMKRKSTSLSPSSSQIELLDTQSSSSSSTKLRWSLLLVVAVGLIGAVYLRPHQRNAMR